MIYKINRFIVVFNCYMKFKVLNKLKKSLKNSIFEEIEEVVKRMFYFLYKILEFFLVYCL